MNYLLKANYGMFVLNYVLRVHYKMFMINYGWLVIDYMFSVDCKVFICCFLVDIALDMRWTMYYRVFTCAPACAWCLSGIEHIPNAMPSPQTLQPERLTKLASNMVNSSRNSFMGKKVCLYNYLFLLLYAMDMYSLCNLF